MKLALVILPKHLAIWLAAKQGQLEKVINGRYSKDKNMVSFIGTFPAA